MALCMSLNNNSDILELLFNSMSFVFWKNKEGVYLGTNSNQAKLFGFSSPEEFINKTVFEILEDQDSAKFIDDIDRKIMREGKSVIVEEAIIVPTQGKRVFLSQKQPIKAHNGEIIGLLGFSMDITEQKEKERLADLDKQKSIKMVEQVVHDIRSPLASLMVILKSCSELPEEKRIALREAGIRIGDISNNLLSQYIPKEAEFTQTQTQERQPTLLSAALLQLLSEKKFQYQSLSVKFDYDFNPAAQFAFVRGVELTSFQRMISNLINNAVDALEGKEGTVMLKLDATHEWVKIRVEDNGKGIPPKLVEKIRRNLAVTEGKVDGHGIGLTQVRETLEQNYGTMTIDSTVGIGTQITLEFPRAKSPVWCSEEIKLDPNTIVIILDDDPSIHRGWDLRFESILKQTSNIHIHHFEKAQATLGFISTLTDDEKKRVFLLADYELLKEELNGLHVIEQSKVQHAMLVTSHYINAKVRTQAVKLGIKILPKQLASEIPILVGELG